MAVVMAVGRVERTVSSETLSMEFSFCFCFKFGFEEWGTMYSNIF